MTLVELLTVMGMAVVLFGAIVPSMFATFNQSGRQSNRITSLDQDRVALDRVTRELRQARCASATGQVLTISDPNSGTGACAGGTQTVRFDCSLASAVPGKKKCVRTTVATGAAMTLIDGLDNVTVFTPSLPTGGRPTVQVYLQKTPAGASRPVILRGGATLRVGAL